MIPVDLKPGDTLGRYEILMPVAKGGMAIVWAARLVGSRGFQKVVAIKTMHPGMTDNEDFEAMFLDEARLASRIRHPHVVEIVDLGEEGDWLYLVMEWVSGETLFTINKRARTKGGIPLPILLRLLSGACAGLQAAHELRDDKGALLDLVHRDISPQNIMVSFNGIVKVVDFGVAKAAGRTHETRVGSLMKGKVPYLSPEQLTGGHKLDRRADIFSLGVLAYVMVTGRHPFKGETDAHTMENICSRAPVSLRDLAPDTREDVEQIIMRALAKDPVDRWPDCAEMQRAVDQVLSSLGKPVTDGDVANFIKELVGDLIEDRNKLLAEAIARADARAAAGGPKAAPKKKSGGGPLAVNAEGILAVVLDDGGTAPEPVNLYTPTPPAIADAGARMTVTPSGKAKSGSLTPIIAVTLLLLLVGAGAAVKLGKVPWLAAMLGLGNSAPAASAAPEAPSVAPTQSAAHAPPNASAAVVPAVVGSAPAAAASSAPTLATPKQPVLPQYVAPRPAPSPAPVATSTGTAATATPTTAIAAPAPTSAPTTKAVAAPASSGGSMD